MTCYVWVCHEVCQGGCDTPHTHSLNVAADERWHVSNDNNSNTALRAGASLSEPPNIPVKPITNIRFKEHPPLSIPNPPFNSKSTELLTGSGEVLVHCIQWWHHHVERGEVIDARAKWAKNFLTATMLKVNLCGPFIFHGPFLLLCDPFTATWGPFTQPW